MEVIKKIFENDKESFGLFVPEKYVIKAIVDDGCKFNIYYNVFFPFTRIRGPSGRLDVSLESRTLLMNVIIGTDLQVGLMSIDKTDGREDLYTKTDTFTKMVNLIRTRVEQEMDYIKIDEVTAVPESHKLIAKMALVFYRDLTAYGFDVTKGDLVYRWTQSPTIFKCRSVIEKVRQKLNEYSHAKFSGYNKHESILSDLCSLDDTNRLSEYIQQIIEGIAGKQEDVIRQRLEPLSHLYTMVRPLCANQRIKEQKPWFDAHTFDELLSVSKDWINGVFTSDHPISNYSNKMSKTSAMDLDDSLDRLLKYLHGLGMVTMDSQPGTCTSDEKRKVYVSCCAKRELAESIFNTVSKSDPLKVVLSSKEGGKVSDQDVVGEADKITVTKLLVDGEWTRYSSIPTNDSNFQTMYHYFTSLLQIDPNEAVNLVMVDFIWDGECEDAEKMLTFLQNLPMQMEM